MKTVLWSSNLNGHETFVDIDSVGLEAVVNYVYTGKVNYTAVTKSTIRKRLLPGYFTFQYFNMLNIAPLVPV